MVNKSVILPVTITLMLSAFQAMAATENQLNSIKHIGQLNGVALHCKFLTEARRMKLVLVARLPKRRQLGQIFDDSTNESFLAFIQNRSVCPDQQQFILKVDAAVADLNQAFSKP